MSDRLQVLLREKQQLSAQEGVFNKEENKVFTALFICAVLAVGGLVCGLLLPTLLPRWFVLTAVGIGAVGIFVFGLWGASLFKGQEWVRREVDLRQAKIEEHQTYGA